MKTIANLVITIIGIAVIAIGACKLNQTYSDAMRYREMNQLELSFMRYTQTEKYNELRNSYEFIVSIPFIGETL